MESVKNTIETELTDVCKQLFDNELTIKLGSANEKFGDYTTTIALQLGNLRGKDAHQIAEQIIEKLGSKLSDVCEVSIAGRGFLNIRLTDAALATMLHAKPMQPLTGKEVIAEYSDANPFKVLHAGHVYTTVVGDAIANLLENAGARVHRVNFGGDVGLHVGKTMWAIVQNLGGEQVTTLATIPKADRAIWMATRYIEGERAYNDNPIAKAEIIEINKRVYQVHTQNDHTSAFAQIYWTCRAWSYEAFDAFFARFGTKLEKYYPESEVAEQGLQTVKRYTGSVFEQSEGATIFNGKKYGLHTRVFINQQGLPTYEAKDVGLIAQKYKDYHFDRSIIITDNEQQQYMEVVLKAIEQFWPDLVHATTHITHGKLKLVGGVKMSSRKGNIIRADELLSMTNEELTRAGRGTRDAIMLGAIKYAFLKVRIGADIVYDPEQSIALEGNSGPYLQYAYVRARNILVKAETQKSITLSNLQSDERRLLHKTAEYAEVIEKATAELMPHYICTYLYELAQEFNRFYEHNRVIGDERQGVRLMLVRQYADRLKAGLNLLGVVAPVKM